MSRLIVFILLCIAVTVFVSACSGKSPTVPSQNQTPIQSSANGVGNHQLLGYYSVYINETHTQAMVTPERGLNLHLNARKLMEEAPCTSCLQITGVHATPDDTLLVDFQVNHPFPGMTVYTAFDMRGIMMFEGNVEFPELGVVTQLYEPGSGQAAMLNAEGYTTLWNPVDFAEGSGNFLILEYSAGKFSSPVVPSTTLNPYLMFHSMEERHVLETTASVTRSYEVYLPPGPLVFGYAIDCSWDAPEGLEQYDVPDAFPVSANCLEPWMISVAPIEGLNDAGEGGIARIHVYDWQGSTTLDSVFIEAPDLYPGLVEASLAEDCIDHSIWEAYIDNPYMTSAGEVDLLIKAQDFGSDAFNGPFAAWNICPVEIEEYDPPPTNIIDPTWPGRAFKIAVDTENTIHAVYSDTHNIYWSYSLNDGHTWVNRGSLWAIPEPWYNSPTYLSIVADDNGYVYCAWATKITGEASIQTWAGRMHPTGPDDPDTAPLEVQVVFDLSGGQGGASKSSFSVPRIFPADDGSLMYYALWYAGTGDFRPRFHYAPDWPSLENAAMYPFDDSYITNGSMTYIYTPSTNFMATDNASNFFMAMSGRYTYDPEGLTMGSFLARYNVPANDWTIIAVYNPPGVNYWDNHHNGICIDDGNKLYWVTEYQVGGSGPYGNDTGTYSVAFGYGDLQGNLTWDDPIAPGFTSDGNKYDNEFYDFSIDITDAGKLFFVYQRSPNEQNAYYIFRDFGSTEWSLPEMVNDPVTTGYMPYAFVAPNQKLYVCYTDLGPDPGVEDDYGYFTSIE